MEMDLGAFVVEGEAVAVPGTIRPRRAVPVVMIHGAGMDHTVWRHQTRVLTDRGWTAVAPDLPGHGHSGGAALTTIEEMGEWLVGFVVRTGLAPVCVVGHSMGSLVGLAAAASNPETVAALVLTATADRMRVHPELMDAARRGDPHAVDLMVGWMHTGEHDQDAQTDAGGWRPETTRTLLEHHLESVLAVDLAACDRYNPVAGAQTVTQPTLVVQGHADKMTPFTAAVRLTDHIRSARLAAIDGAGHMTPTDQPRTFADALVGFLEETAA